MRRGARVRFRRPLASRPHARGLRCPGRAPRVGASELPRAGRREGARAAAAPPVPPSPHAAAAESAGSRRGLGGGVWPQLLLLLLHLAPSICRGYGPSLEHKRVPAVEVCVGLALPRLGVRKWCSCRTF